MRPSTSTIFTFAYKDLSMKKTQLTSYKSIVLLMLFGVMIASCVPQRKMLYLQPTAADDTTSYFLNERSETYLIQPGDNLYIKVVSLDERTSNLFNPLEGRTGGSNVNDQSIYLNSYTVSDKGTIEFPLAGEIVVQNLNVEQVKAQIQLFLDDYLKETVLIVKLVNFNLTMLGEVRRPGQYKVYQSEINIFQAVSMAGDLADFANREEVIIIRQSKNGSETHTVNLASNSILSSDFYYLKPNDIIYVKPLAGKQFTFANFPYAVVFSAISTLILTLNFVTR